MIYLYIPSNNIVVSHSSLYQLFHQPTLFEEIINTIIILMIRKEIITTSYKYKYNITVI